MILIIIIKKTYEQLFVKCFSKMFFSPGSNLYFPTFKHLTPITPFAPLQKGKTFVIFNDLQEYARMPCPLGRGASLETDKEFWERFRAGLRARSKKRGADK